MPPGSSIICIFINSKRGVAINPAEGCEVAIKNKAQVIEGKKKKKGLDRDAMHYYIIGVSILVETQNLVKI